MGMKAAYQMAEELLRDRMGEDAPGALNDLKAFSEHEVIVTSGCYDSIQRVFAGSGIAHTVVEPAALDAAPLDPDHVVFVNCPGRFSRGALARLRRFVRDGGFVFTTDWALGNVVEPAFPGFIEYNGVTTADDVVRVEFARADDPFLGSMLGPQDEPHWWLEGSSHPIRVLDEDAVEVLIRSDELERKYGEAPVLWEKRRRKKAASRRRGAGDGSRNGAGDEPSDG